MINGGNGEAYVEPRHKLRWLLVQWTRLHPTTVGLTLTRPTVVVNGQQTDAKDLTYLTHGLGVTLATGMLEELSSHCLQDMQETMVQPWRRYDRSDNRSKAPFFLFPTLSHPKGFAVLCTQFSLLSVSGLGLNCSIQFGFPTLLFLRH